MNNSSLLVSDQRRYDQPAAQPTVAPARGIPFSTTGSAKEPTSAVPDPLPWSKRALDITCILLAFPLLAPVFLLIAIWIKIGSPGPILFHQERVGYRGRRFVCFKFRSMTNGSDPAVHERHWNQVIRSGRPMVKLDTQGDQRLIRGGRLLRASGLDELPQLFNVLSGEMSLVGPRPCIPYEAAMFLPWQHERFDAVPGLTGLWQVNGKNRTTLDEMMHYDIEYARHRSWWLDVKILLQTIPAVTDLIRDAARQKCSPAAGGFTNGALLEIKQSTVGVNTP